MRWDTERREKRATTAERIFLATDATFAGLCSFKGVGEQRFNHHVGRQILMALVPPPLPPVCDILKVLGGLAWHNNIVKQKQQYVTF